MFKQTLKNHFPKLFSILHNCRELYYCILGRYFPERLISTWYQTVFHKAINLDNPKDICEKINWMKLHADTRLWTECADKIRVRNYIKSHGLEHTLNTIYGIYDSADQIDYNLLPHQFVMKTNNGGGGNNILIVTDKDKLDINQTNKLLNKWLRKRVGDRYVEKHYKKIQPKIIIERYLNPPKGEKSLVDIKVYCFDGNAHSIFFCSDRQFGEHVCYSVYDLNWNLCQEKVIKEYRTTKRYSKPESLQQIIDYSKVLSKGIPFVRMDWYEINKKPIFSEMTFTPGSGFLTFHSMDYLLELGEQCKLPKAIR